MVSPPALPFYCFVEIGVKLTVVQVFVLIEASFQQWARPEARLSSTAFGRRLAPFLDRLQLHLGRLLLLVIPCWRSRYLAMVEEDFFGWFANVTPLGFPFSVFSLLDFLSRRRMVGLAFDPEQRARYHSWPENALRRPSLFLESVSSRFKWLAGENKANIVASRASQAWPGQAHGAQ